MLAQMDALRLLGEGRTYGVIAGRIFASPKTVEHHVSAIRTRGEHHATGAH